MGAVGEGHGWRARLAGAPSGRPRVRGRPVSANGASSFHLRWVVPPGLELVGAGVTLTVVEPPRVPSLYFWALQVSFGAGAGAHLGLQWGADPPRRLRHLNWGGYDGGGAELAGTGSELPSSFGNPNTRDFDWDPGRPYRLGISREPEGWAGRVDGRLVRHLGAPGDGLTAPMVWSEVIADCDAPSVVVRWSELEVLTRSGSSWSVEAVATSYQDRRSGGCDNTSSSIDGAAFVQTTGVERVEAPGRLLRLG